MREKRKRKQFKWPCIQRLIGIDKKKKKQQIIGYKFNIRFHGNSTFFFFFFDNSKSIQLCHFYFMSKYCSIFLMECLHSHTNTHMNERQKSRRKVSIVFKLHQRHKNVHYFIFTRKNQKENSGYLSQKDIFLHTFSARLTHTHKYIHKLHANEKLMSSRTPQLKNKQLSLINNYYIIFIPIK